MAKVILNFDPSEIQARGAIYAVPSGKYLLHIDDAGYAEEGHSVYLRPTVEDSEDGEYIGARLASIFVSIPQETSSDIREKKLPEEKEKTALSQNFFRRRDVADLMRATNIPLVKELDTDDLVDKTVMAELIYMQAMTSTTTGKRLPAKNQVRQIWSASEWKKSDKPAKPVKPAVVSGRPTVVDTPPAAAPTPSDEAAFGDEESVG